MTWFDRDVTADEEQHLAGYMTRLGDSPLPRTARMPDADLVWVKAQMLRRWEAERRVQAPLDLMEPVQIAAGLAAAAVLLVWALPSLLKVF
ncbi:MAG TPA: hypothetical protein VGF24_15030 [Vicinamibacterales bacterium]|jgi:hypothetical protein